MERRKCVKTAAWIGCGMLLLLVILCGCSLLQKKQQKETSEFLRIEEIPLSLKAGQAGSNHCQGIAIDRRNGFMYYSYTTCLLKTDLKGKVVGSVTGFLGHLGCLAMNPEDGRLYASLEFKHDAIGQAIINQTGHDVEDGFYVVRFDCDRIDRQNMDAVCDDIMQAIYIPEVMKDFTEGHRYGCAGIDGVTFAPAIGSAEGKMLLYTSYGIYSDLTRTDNDYQVLLSYDISDWDRYAAPLTPEQSHRNGPTAPVGKYFVYTGNTNYGIQNLEYDPYTGCFLAAVYAGKKPEFPNYTLFAIDQRSTPVREQLKGTDEEAMVLRLKNFTEDKTETPGWYYKYGSYGMIALGEGCYYITVPDTNKTVNGVHVRLYHWNGTDPFTR